MPSPDDHRPTRRDLVGVGREVLPPSPWPASAYYRGVMRAFVRVVALGAAALSLPQVGFPGDGHPDPVDVAAVSTGIALLGLLWPWMWCRFAGRPRGVTFAATVIVLDLAALRVADVLMGDGFFTDAGWELLAAAGLLGLATAVHAAVEDAFAHPDSVALPD